MIILLLLIIFTLLGILICLYLPQILNVTNIDTIFDAIKELKLNEFGDFVGGTLNPLLSFFSFMALLYTIFIQREQLESQKKEFEKSFKAQENNVKLSALMAIFQEDVKKFNNNKDIIENHDDLERKGILDCIDAEDEHDIRQSYKIASKTNEILNDRRTIVIAEIEKILCESGVALPKIPMD